MSYMCDCCYLLFTVIVVIIMIVIITVFLAICVVVVITAKRMTLVVRAIRAIISSFIRKFLSSQLFRRTISFIAVSYTSTQFIAVDIDIPWHPQIVAVIHTYNSLQARAHNPSQV